MLVSNGGADASGTIDFGWRSQVTTEAATRRRLASSIARLIKRRWPRCTPSKVPTVTTVGPNLPSSACTPRTTFASAIGQQIVLPPGWGRRSALPYRLAIDMERTYALIATLAVGGLVALQPPANAMLARAVSDLGAAFVSLLISVTIVGVLLVIWGDPSSLKAMTDFRPAYVIGGLGGAAIVLVTLVTVRWLGAGGVVAALVVSQLLISILADRFGILGLPVIELSAQRMLGMLLLVAGTFLVIGGKTS
jgi:transporter family-2 protein